MLVFFFFFQAEDGIRDTSVTGVQTCALPISLSGLVKRLFRVFVLGREPHAPQVPCQQTEVRMAVAQESVRPGLGELATGEIGRASCKGRGEVVGVGVGWNRDRMITTQKRVVE